LIAKLDRLLCNKIARKMKPERHNKDSATSAGSRCFVILLTIIAVSLFVDRVTAGVQNPAQYRQVVASMKADIKAGRVVSIPVSNKGNCCLLSSYLRSQFFHIIMLWSRSVLNSGGKIRGGRMEDGCPLAGFRTPGV